MESEMTCNVSEMWRPKMPTGMDFEISHHPLTMRRVVNLVIAMERFKGSSSECVLSTEFSDENLLNIMLDSIVEEEIVFDCQSAPPSQITWISEEQCTMTDSQKRSIVQDPNSMELNAVTLQGGAETKNVLFNMSTYLHPASGVQGRTVALSIKNTNLYLCCRKDGDNDPTLHLEEVADRSLLSGSNARFNADSDMVRFLFYRQDSGVNLTTLMSVAHNNWYISTAQDNRPMKMCLESAQCYRTFSIRDPQDLSSN